MNDAFYEFDWPVAPGYQWQPWVNDEGEAITPSANFLNQLERDVSECATRFGQGGVNSSSRGASMARAYSRREQQRAQFARSSGPILTRIDAGRSNSYRPMEREHAALFRRFATLDHRDLNAILGFASRYGDLGLIHKRQTVPVRNSLGRLLRWHSVSGESHAAWAIEICHMREALRLSELTSFDSLRRLRWLSELHLPDVRAGLTFDKTQRPRLSVRPLTLISALWLQLALAITGDKRFVECKFCRNLFEISTEQTGFRSHREFCSDSCKTKDYRKRKRMALRLAQEGNAVRVISEKTSTDSDTIRGWLSGDDARKVFKRGK